MTAESPTPELAQELMAAGKNEIAARILEAALYLFAEKGYAATSVREIVQRAEVTNPMLYYYFESKKGVFAELNEYFLRGMAEFMSKALAAEASLEAKLRAVARVHFEACRKRPVILRFVYSVLFGPIKSRPQLDVFQPYEAALAKMSKVFAQAMESGEFVARPGQDPRFLTERFMGLINNHLMGILASADFFAKELDSGSVHNEYLSVQALDRMVDFFFHGAGTLTKESK